MICPYCNKKAKWCENSAIYGKNYGKSYMCYYCKPCDAYVGCHQNTRNPLGSMANKELRQLRIKVHDKIDPLWKSGRMTRKEVYKKMSRKIGSQFHVSWLSKEQCLDVLELKDGE